METVCLTQSYEAETRQIVEDVFSSMLRMDVECVNEPGPPAATPIMTATVHFVGSWKGALRIECTPEQTFEYARRLLGIDVPVEVNEDVADSFGELANMIGGNLKAVLPPKVQLSMPSVVRGVDYSVRICKTVTACRLAFDSELGVFWVALVEFVEP
jgi:CheY-specific phosphatase CheX